MNRLQLCQQVATLLRLEGRVGVDPTTTIGQTGALYEVVNFVDRAYQDIQTAQNYWRFRTKRGSLQTVNGTRVYTITSSVTDFEALLPSMAQSGVQYLTFYLTDTGVSAEQRSWYVPYEEWRQGVLDMGTRPSSAPVRFTIEPDNQIAFDPTPDAAYTIVFDYRRTLHTLTTDSDATTGTPIIPAQFHMAIVWKACLYYATTRPVDANLITVWREELRREMNALHNSQLPEYTL